MKSRRLAARFDRCVKTVRKTVKPRKGSTKESGAIAICTTSVLHPRGRTLKRYRRGRLTTQKKFRGGLFGMSSNATPADSQAQKNDIIKSLAALRVSGRKVTLQGYPDMSLKSGLLLAKDKITKDADKKEMLDDLYEDGEYDAPGEGSYEDGEMVIQQTLKNTVAGLQAKAASMPIRA